MVLILFFPQTQKSAAAAAAAVSSIHQTLSPYHSPEAPLIQSLILSTTSMAPLLFFLLLCFPFPSLSQQPSAPLGSQISPLSNSPWLSPAATFAFGFLPTATPNTFVAAIFHNIPSGPSSVPVWTVGGGITISEISTAYLSPSGSLLLYDSSRSTLPVWSTDTDHLGVRYASLTDSGNLVLVGFGGRTVWESFAGPTDTLLPGQPLRYPQSLRAAASPDSIASYYSLLVRSFGEISLVWEHNVTYWRSQLARSSVQIREARLDADGMLGLFDYGGGVPWFRLSKDFKDPSVKLRRLRLEPDGNLRIYSWDNASSAWKVTWQAVQNQCDVFGSCGLYSVCSYNDRGPYCDCLNQDSVSGSSCEKMADLGNCDKGLSMMPLKQTLLYSLYPPHDVDVMLSADECRSYCLNDTNCFAATAMNDGSGLCTIKRTSFISGSRYSSVQAVSFLKVYLVPQAVSAQAANLHGSMRLPPTEEQQQQQPVAQTLGNWRSYRVAIVVLLLVTGFVFLTVEMVVFWFILYKRHRRSAAERRRNPFGKDIGLNVHYSALVRLSLEEVKELTKNFGNKLGSNVYKGVLPNKIMVTVKALDDVVAAERDFQLVASTLGSTHHRNLIALKGFCYELSHKILVYEYISNSSLDEWLLKQNKKDGWSQRLSIAIGIARALVYLHSECKQCIPHGNLKLENVLLDDYLVPKLTDFGLQSLLKLDTAAASSETLPERDVHMFGSILLRIVSGKIGASEEKLRDSAYEACANGGFVEFVDDQLKGGVEFESVQRVVRLALWCMQDKPDLRPSIGEVVMVLEGSLSLDMHPMPQASKAAANRRGGGSLDIVEVTL